MVFQWYSNKEGSTAFSFLVGVSISIFVSTAFISRHILGSDTPWWMTFLAYAAFTVASAFLAAGLLGRFARRSSHWTRRCNMLRHEPAMRHKPVTHPAISVGGLGTTRADPSLQTNSPCDLHMRLSPGAMRHKRAFRQQHSSSKDDHPIATPTLRVIEGGHGRTEPPDEIGIDIRLFDTPNAREISVADRINSLLGQNISRPPTSVTQPSGIGRVKFPKATAEASKEDWHQLEKLMSAAKIVFVDADLNGDIVDTLDLCMRMRNSAPETIIIWVPVKHKETA